MMHANHGIRWKKVLFWVGVLIFLITTLSVAHGPGGHSGGDFTSLQAVKKGLELYDRLVSGGKLEESWEIDLVNIEIETRGHNGKHEYVVKFNRKASEPSTVFIFFSEDGDYKGSNFTGD